MNIVELIIKKSEGKELTKNEILFFVNSYTSKEITDYQASAMLMAIKLKGMTNQGTFAITQAYLESGHNFEPKNGKFFDMHSTGGVGDKVSIALLPLLGAMGMNSLKLSGRGLGFTGGTIDKLESLKGFKTELPKEKVMALIDNLGLALINTTDEIVPADKAIYALRDVTGTVDSIPLIAASIMSKKIASGSEYIFIDMKTGSGAFMPSEEKALELGRIMKDIGNHFGKSVYVALTSMNQPLGRAIGNGNEIKEAVEIINGKGPEDATRLITKIASEIYSSANNVSVEESIKQVEKVMFDGSANKKFESWIESQGADMEFYKEGKYFNPKITTYLKSKKTGYVSFKDTKEFGYLAIELKAGRKIKTDKINFHNGFELLKKHGDKVEKYDEIIKIFSETALSTDFLERVHSNFIMSDEKPVDDKLIISEIKW